MYVRRFIQATLWSLVVAMLCISANTQSDAALSFNAGRSAVSYTHQVIEGSSTSASRLVEIAGSAIPAGPGAVFQLPELTLTESFGELPEVTSKARAGFGQITAPIFGTGTVKSGTLVTQTDPANQSDEFSTLEIDFNLVWDITPPRFGPPIQGAFNVPVLAVVGAGGAAKAEIINMQWQKDTAGTITDLRAPANIEVNFAPGTTLTALSVPPALFSPFLLLPTDDLIVSGKVKFSAKNADQPVFFYQELPSLETFFADTEALVHLAFNEQAPGNVAGGQLFNSITGAPIVSSSYGGSPLHVAGIPQNPGDAAVQFPNSSDGAALALNTFPSFTAEAFFASDSAGAYSDNTGGTPIGSSTIFGDLDDNGFIVRTVVGTNRVEAIINDSGGGQFSLGEFVVPGDITDFHHAALSFDDASKIARFYLDGIEVGSIEFLGLNRNSSTFFPFIGQDFFGRVDEFSYYDSPIDPAFIQAAHLIGQTDPTNFQRIVGAFIDPTLVPEPTTAVLGLIGLAGLARRRRRSIA